MEPQIRCFSCDCELSDFESTRKSKITQDYLDLCEDCFSTITDEFVSIEEQEEDKRLKEEQNDL